MNTNKMVQALTYLMRLANVERISYMKALKLLYLVDRESLRRTGVTMTGDIPCAMKHGPVLSKTYDLIKLDPDFDQKNEDEQLWCSCFRREGYDLVLFDDVAGDDELSERDKEILQEIHCTYGATGKFELRDITHDFPEWKNTFRGEGSRPIPLSEIAKAVGLGQEDQEIIREMESARVALEDAFGGAVE